MNQLLDEFWPIFNNFRFINHQNIKHFNENGNTLTAAQIASRIYRPNYIKEVRGQTQYTHIPYTFSYEVRCDLIRRPQDDNNALLVIRGSAHKKNWVLNRKYGKDIFLYILKKVTFSLVTIVFLAFYFKSWTPIIMALPLYFFLSLIFDSHVKTVFTHEGYADASERILNHYNIDPRLNLIVIGHSMGGGIGEYILQSRPNTKAFFFNKAPLNTGLMNDDYRDHSVDHRLSFDILSHVTIHTFGAIKKSGTLKSKLTKSVFVFYTLIFTFTVSMLFIGIHLKIQEGLMYFLATMIMVINIIIIGKIAKAFFPDDHLLKEVIEAIEEERFIY